MSLPHDPARKSIHRAILFSVVTVCSLFSLVAVATVLHYRKFSETKVAVVSQEKAEVVPIRVFPDFASFQEVDVKKQMFLDFLQIYIEQQNVTVLQRRNRVLALSDIVSNGVSLSEGESNELQALASLYFLEVEGMREPEIIFELLKRVDIIPVSLALAQAATESAWGTSRFALEANNIFGQWCYEEGCGLVPYSRAKDAGHEVRSFSSIEGSVRAYFMNLNTHDQYEGFRHMRFQMRNQRGDIDPLVLVYGLSGYSARGDHYIDQIQTIIQQNNLLAKDNG